jgi:predicted Rossmann-fold nucleotide-binding protein
MLAAAQGAHQAGGDVIGVTCSAFGGRANEYISKEIVTASLSERLDKLIELGAGYVVLPGGTGTLLELAMVWELKNKGFLQQDKPVIIIGDFWKELINTVRRDDAGSLRYIQQAFGPEKAVELLKARLS